MRWQLAQIFERYWRFKQTMNLGAPDYLEWVKNCNLKILKKLYGFKKYDFEQMFKNSTLIEYGGGKHGFLPFIKAKVKINVDPLNKDRIYHDVLCVKMKGEDFLIRDFADVIFCSNVLNHVDDDLGVLLNISDTLKETGLLLFDVHIQPKSVNHPYTYSETSIHKLINKLFQITEYKVQTTHEIFGKGEYPDIPIWYCSARRKKKKC